MCLATPFLRKISLAKPKKHFEIEYAFYLPLPLKSTNETTSVLLSSPPIWKFKLRRKGTKLRQDDEKRDKESFCIQMFNTKKESTSFSMDSHNCWYFQSIMLFNMRKIVRFPLTLFLDHVVTFFMLLVVHTLAGRGRAMDNVKIRGLKKKTSHLQLISSLKQNCKMLLSVYQIILGWCPL